MSVEVGEQAPDFELKDQHGTPVRLSSFQGTRNVVIVFYPLAFSGVCSGELSALRDDFPENSREVVELLTISVDSTFVLRTWADRDNFDFGLCRTSGRTAASQSFTEYSTKTRAWRRGERSSLTRPESSGGKW